MYISPASPDNKAIRETAESSNRTAELMEKLFASTEKLSKSSERLEHLTNILIYLTILLFGSNVVIILIPPDNYVWVKAIGLISVVAIAVIWNYILKIKRAS
jgi:hypothetical protein